MKRAGKTRTPTYISWQNAKQRCFYPKDIGYARYGGRGITMCDRWANSFAEFLWDMGDRPDGMTLDRINPDGNYESGNCRWATPKQQQRNARNSIKLSADELARMRTRRGEGADYAALGSEFGVSAMTAHRIIKGSWRA